MKKDYFEKLAKLMRIDAEGLRAAGLPREKVARIFHRARRAKVMIGVSGTLLLPLILATGFAMDNLHNERLADWLSASFMILLSVVTFTARPSAITSEVAVAMSRRLAEREKEAAK
jgi:hypothetical protein